MVGKRVQFDEDISQGRTALERDIDQILLIGG
jgi:hypothetical protein